MNENLSRLTVQITKHQHKLLKYHAKLVHLYLLVRQHYKLILLTLKKLSEKNTLAAEYEQYEKYMAAQQAAGIEQETVVVDASSIF